MGWIWFHEELSDSTRVCWLSGGIELSSSDLKLPQTAMIKLELAVYIYREREEGIERKRATYNKRGEEWCGLELHIRKDLPNE